MRNPIFSDRLGFTGGTNLPKDEIPVSKELSGWFRLEDFGTLGDKSR